MPALFDMRGAETYLARKGWYSSNNDAINPRFHDRFDSLSGDDSSDDDAYAPFGAVSRKVPLHQRPNALFQQRRPFAPPVPSVEAAYGDENTFCLFNMD